MTNSLRASVEGLAMVDRARRQRGWTKTSTARWWQDAHTSRATLRRFWQGDRIQRDIFIALCQVVGISQWEQIADPELTPIVDPFSESNVSTNPLCDLNEAPDVENFYGRNQELHQLAQWIVRDRDKLVTLLGMGGIGKTALALALVDQIGSGQGGQSLSLAAAPFHCVIWRSLQRAPTLPQLLDSLLHTLSAASMPPIAHTVQTCSAQLLKYLRERRCLLVLDGLEAILDGNHAYRSGYENYGSFLLRLSQERHHSCILLTSREKLPGFVSDGARSHSLLLRGLPGEAALNLLKSKHLTGIDQGGNPLIRFYGGNPLALKLVVPLIRDLYQGNVIAYLGQNTVVMGVALRSLLKQQLARLSDGEREIVYWLAIWQEPISLYRLQSHILCTPDPAAVLANVVSLAERSLLERVFSNDELLVMLQPFVMKAVSDELVEQATQEIGQAMQTNQTNHFRVLRTHCLLRPGTDSRAGKLILIQLGNQLRHTIGGNLQQLLNGLLPILQDQSPFTVGYAAHNLSALLRILN